MSTIRHPSLPRMLTFDSSTSRENRNVGVWDFRVIGNVKTCMDNTTLIISMSCHVADSE